MTDLVKWLREQLDDDERVALAAGGENWPDSAHEMWTNELVHARRHDPARVLRRVAADRGILDAYDQTEFGDFTRRSALEEVIEALSLPYADRPGYREDWRP